MKLNKKKIIEKYRKYQKDLKEERMTYVMPDGYFTDVDLISFIVDLLNK